MMFPQSPTLKYSERHFIGNDSDINDNDNDNNKDIY